MVRSVEPERVRTAEIVAALGLATDLAIGLPLEHGFKTTLVAMRISERLGVDPATARQTYFGCLLFYAGCTADAVRERQTLALLAKGLVVKQVARTLGVTPKTADHYVQRVYTKIGVSTRAAAAVYAMQNGIVTWENTHSSSGPSDS